MTWVAQINSLVRRLLHRRRAEDDLNSEVQSYLAILAERYAGQGMTPEAARRAARVECGGPEQIKQHVRDARTGALLEASLSDIRYSFNALRRTPGFTTIAVLTLALGIGANTAIYSLIEAVMLRALPVEQPRRLALLTDPASTGAAVDTTEHGVRENLSYPEFEELRRENTVFSGMFAAQNDVSNVEVFVQQKNADRPSHAHRQLVSGEFFQVLGIHPIIGRAFTPREDSVPGANPVAVISYDFWRREFTGDPAAVGSTVRVGQAVFTILGVGPPGFRGILVGADADLWLPITMQEQALPGRHYLKARDTLWLQVMGRLKPGMSWKSAEAGINVTFHRILVALAPSVPAGRLRRQLLEEKIALRSGARGASALRGRFSNPLVLLMAMVGVVLLIACANIANLTLVRAGGRQREIGVRLALGVARERLIRQLLTESLLVAGMGGALGVLFAAAGTRLLLAMVAGGAPPVALSALGDSRVLVFAAGLSLATAIIFGMAPAIRATQVDVSQVLCASTRGSLGSQSSIRTGRILAVAQVALSMVLLVGAVLLLRSLHNIIAENVGYNREHLIMARVDPLSAGYRPATVTALYEKVLSGLRAVPGVTAVTVSNNGLFSGHDSGDHISVEGSPVRDLELLVSQWSEVGPEYFRTIGIPLLQGRELDAADALRGTPVCVVNDSFARKFFPTEGAIGKHVTDEYPTTRETFEIVGVAADAREHRPNESPDPRFYANLTHPIGAVGAVTFLIRTQGELGAAIRQSIRRIDPALPLLSLLTVDEQLGDRLVTDRLLAQLAAFFGGIALFMAAIGLYGVVSYSISGRTGEIGVRMALGASGWRVVQMVLGETLGMVAIGLAAGVPCALAIGRFLSSRLYGLNPADPLSIAFAGLIILLTAAIAGFVPARRASRVDPMFALRHD